MICLMLIISCPNCGGMIEIESINCMIFRHAIYKDGRPYNPHSTDQQVEQDKEHILGCGVQFKYDGTNEPIIYNESI